MLLKQDKINVIKPIIMLAWAALYVHAFVSDTGPGCPLRPQCQHGTATEQATDHSHGLNTWLPHKVTQCLAWFWWKERPWLVPGLPELRPLLLLPNHAHRWLKKWPLLHSSLVPYPLPFPVSPRAATMVGLLLGSPSQPPKACNWQLSQRPYLLPQSLCLCWQMCPGVPEVHWTHMGDPEFLLISLESHSFIYEFP